MYFVHIFHSEPIMSIVQWRHATYLCNCISKTGITEQQPTTRSYSVRLVLKLLWPQFVKVFKTINRLTDPIKTEYGEARFKKEYFFNQEEAFNKNNTKNCTCQCSMKSIKQMKESGWSRSFNVMSFEGPFEWGEECHMPKWQRQWIPEPGSTHDGSSLANS